MITTTTTATPPDNLRVSLHISLHPNLHDILPDNRWVAHPCSQQGDSPPNLLYISASWPPILHWLNVPRQPTMRPSRQPVSCPTTQPSRQPTHRPTLQPSKQPTTQVYCQCTILNMCYFPLSVIAITTLDFFIKSGQSVLNSHSTSLFVLVFCETHSFSCPLLVLSPTQLHPPPPYLAIRSAYCAARGRSFQSAIKATFNATKRTT